MFSSSKKKIKGWMFLPPFSFKLMQVVWMLEFIHNGAFFMDPTLGTNVQRYHLFIIIMFDHHRQELLMAWVISQVDKWKSIWFNGCYHWRNKLWIRTPLRSHYVSLWMTLFNNIMQYNIILSFNIFLKNCSFPL
jgi:hypothetical protein